MKPTALTTLTLAGTLLLASCGANPFSGDTAEPDGAGTAEEAEVPAFGDIQDEMWEAMLSAETVTLEGQVQAGDAELDELFSELDEDAVGDITVTGALDGTDSQMSYSAGEGHSFTHRAVGGVEYFRGEDFGSLFYSELDEEIADLVDPEFLDEFVAEQWVALSEDGAGSIFSAEDFLRTWQQELEGDQVEDIEGVRETRGGQVVYVYAEDDGDAEYVVAADGPPYLLQLEDQQNSYTFTDWNSTDTPEEPENIITLDDLVEAIAEQQDWPADQ